LIKSQFFKNLLKENLKKDYGFTRPKHLMNLEIYLPSLEEQKQIAEKLKLNEEKQKNLQLQINQQKTNLKNLRKQILQDAIEGKLTKEWREKNPDIEPASELLKKIKKEKEKLIAEKKIKKEKPLPEINKNELPFELPESWVWTRLGEIGLVNRGKSPKYDQGSNAFSLNQKCVRWDYIDTIFAKEIKSDWLIKIDKSFLTQVGDILVNSTGEGTIGRSAVVDEISNKMIFDSHVLCFRGVSFIKAKFFTSVINSSFGQFQINESKGAKSTKQTELGVTNLRNIFSPLPPLPEQLAIVSKLQTLMQKLDEVEKQIEKNLAFSKQLSKVILAEAFNQNNLEKK
jgi:type I restriction enzyme S subunit